MENILYIVWEEKYDIGIEIIDEQHRGIVSSINSLYYYVKEGNGVDALQPTINIIEQYIKLHFKTEERLMEKAGFPDMKEHILMHEKLKRDTKYVAVSSVFEKNSDKILKFLKDWWLNHINVEDRKYAPYVLKIAR